jgi:phenylalanyl-tRNA synthetase alpha chain
VSDSPHEILEQAAAAVGACKSLDSLEGVRLRYLGRKGEITRRLRGVSQLPPAERPEAGRRWNEVRNQLADAVLARRAELEAGEAEPVRSFDPTLPGRRPPYGVPHVLRQTVDDLVRIFCNLGFSVADGPEVETPHYNFSALNIPEDHPTRDEHDSFFLGPDLLLRTQTSPVQIRVMERMPPPVRVVSPGRVYRRDVFDASHSPYFFQLEGLHVDEDVHLGDLKGTLRIFVREFFGAGIDMRFRGGYFPFTEPSLELDIGCTICGGAGCSACKRSGWVEILGCGMVHPNVLRGVGYDPDRVSGYAFGMGPDRITMLRHCIPDIRLLYENDLRFLHQFRGRG